MSNKKPSELAVWNKDKSMVVHAHKPGVSQKVSIQDIIDAVPVPEMPEIPELPEPVDITPLIEDISDLSGRVGALEDSGGVVLPGRFEVGSYVLGYLHTGYSEDPDQATDSANTNYRLVSGSGLRMASVGENSGSINPGVGTWKQMSWAVSGGADYLARSTIYMRIA